MQIPESPPQTASDRPGTSFTEESARNPSVSQDHAAADAITPAPVSQPEPAATNGTTPNAPAGIHQGGLGVFYEPQ